MALRDLFNENEAVNIIAQQSMQSASKEVESVDYLVEFNKDKNRYIPYVDYSDPANFAFYGSAEEYYERAILYIRDDYPYDGSFKEKLEWRNEATLLDLYMLDKEYPRTNGHINLHRNGYGNLTDAVAFKGGTYAITSNANAEYILFKGGPNVNNIYDSAKSREENLKLDLSGSGVTVEFWAKVVHQMPTIAQSGAAGGDSAVIFDLWNGQNTGGTNYGRFTIGVNNIALSSSSWFFVHANSGSTGGLYESGSGGLFSNWTRTDVEGTGWHHYAFTAFNSGSDLKFELFVDGQLKQTSTTSGQAVGLITGSMIATLGATVAFPDWVSTAPGTISSPVGRGYGAFSGSIDEFRYWKRRRTPKEIGRYYRSQVGGGTNSDDANTELGVYYKFNEGITGNAVDDAIVLDYSGRLTNGAWSNYSSGARLTSSAMVEAEVATYEFLDPIVKSSHPDVKTLITSSLESGSLHDMNNPTMLYNSYPTWIIEEDEATDGNLKIMTQILGSYLDTVHLQIENLKNLKTKNYISASHKPMPHANRLLTSVGFVAPNIFVDADVIEQFDKRSEEVLFEDHIHNIKNTIYQNIYNNIDYIFKTKGTVKSFRNLLRAYGIDDELVKFNLYANNATHELKTNYDVVSVKKNYADFNAGSRNVALVYATSSLSGTSPDNSLRYRQTTECEVRFPRKKSQSDPSYYWYPYVSSSMFGMLASGSNVSGAFGVYAVRDKIESEDVKFVLSSAFGYLTSSVYRNTYDNQQWNFAVRVKPEKPKGDLATFGTENYIWEFTGMNTVAGILVNEFTVTSSIADAYVNDVLQTKKRPYVGAARSTISGGIVQRSDVRIGSLRHWYSDITNKELFEHAKNPFNIGVERPFDDVGTTLAGVSNLEKTNTLAVAWDFQSSSATNTSGFFFTKDFSSGSVTAQTRYGELGEIIKKKYDGVGRFYSASDAGAVDVDYVSAYKQRMPESLNSYDMVDIGEDRDMIFTKESRPVDYFWAFEKSMAQNISDEILNFFATINDFNNLIGEPVHRYRPEYKSLAKFRQLFFQRFENEIDYERYISFYKWVDSSINLMLEKLIPLSANTSGRIRNVVESHVLERAKIQTKFPTLEIRQKDPETSLQGVGQMLYNWKYAHAPLSGLTNDDQNLYWWLTRAERDGVLTSGITSLDNAKEAVKDVINTETTGSHPKFYDTRTAATYAGTPYHLKNSKPYRLEATLDIRDRRVDPMLLDAELNDTPTVSMVVITGEAANTFKTTPEEETMPAELIKSKTPAEDLQVTQLASNQTLKIGSRKFLPWKIVSSSVNTGYRSGLSLEVNNLHRDTYGTADGVPLQGPFTEKFVGGHPARHEEVTQNPSDTQDDTRGERFRLTFGAGQYIVSKTLGLSNHRWYRDEFAKRPVNIANRQYTTGTTAQIGNFQKNYEVVQTSGRSQNNLWFREAQGILSSSVQESTAVSGVVDFALPNRSVQKTVFVERFSAPGDPSTMSRGYLDAVAEEFSAYNQLNYRNLTVRQPLQTLLTRHCGQFGIDSVNGSPSASYHKVNRNTLTRMELSGGVVVSGSQHDNWYVQHAIPRSDRQYAWITGSLKSWSPSGIPDTN